ncbi:MAG: hypothetical protein RSH78_04380 [Bacilli bacterium]
MLKNKFERMNKEDKLKAIKEYNETEYGKNEKPRLNRLLVISILCFCYSVFLFLDTFFTKHNFWAYTLTVIVLIFGIVFLIGRHKILVRNVNNYVIKNKK